MLPTKRINPHEVKGWEKESHLHTYQPVPNPKGNRAERRKAKKEEKRKNKW